MTLTTQRSAMSTSHSPHDTTRQSVASTVQLPSVVILGCGRSGTSMVASLFEECGLFQSQTLLEATSGNPLGFFESHELNELNNDIIDALLSWPVLDWKIRRRLSIAPHADRRVYWLAAPARIANIRLTSKVEAHMADLVKRVPFCFKDPRFCATIPHWKKVLPPETRYIVVYRNPALTAASILKFVAEQYETPIHITTSWLFTMWYRSYSRLLTQFADNDKCVFVSYEDMASGHGVYALEQLTGYSLAQERIRPETRRTVPQPELLQKVPHWCRELYTQLQRLSTQNIRRVLGELPVT